MDLLPSYVLHSSAVQRADARVKLVVLVVGSVVVFFVDTWAGLGILALACVALVVVSRLPFVRLASFVMPVLAVLAFVWVFNAFSLDVSVSQPTSGLAGGSSGFAAGWAPVALWGTFGFVPEGAMRGLFYVVRILLICCAGLVVALTTSAENLADALGQLIAPARRVHIPVDDIVLTLSMTLRFIPLVSDELQALRRAQAARGARFEEGNPVRRLATWTVVLTPLVVGLFRRGMRTATALEARAYGAGPRTSLSACPLPWVQGVILCVACASLVCLALVF